MSQKIYDLYDANSFVDTPVLRVEFPQILEAYFAEIKTTETNEVQFEFIQSTSVKTEVYVVIETTNFKGNKVKLSIKEKSDDTHSGQHKLIKLLVEGKEVDFVEAIVGDWNMGELDNKERFENWAVFKLELVRRRKGNIQWGNNIQVATEKNNNRLCLVVDAHTPNADYANGSILYYGNKNPLDNYSNIW